MPINTLSPQISTGNLESSMTTYELRNRKYINIKYSRGGDNGVVYLNYSIGQDMDDSVMINKIESDKIDLDFLEDILADSIEKIPKTIAFIKIEVVDPGKQKLQELYTQIGTQLQSKGKIQKISIYGDQEGICYQIRKSQQIAQQMMGTNRMSMQLCMANTI